jgi:hypothetical protein
MAGVHVRTLHRACEQLGGLGPLARTLKVRPLRLMEWLDGVTPVPEEIFLAAVDIVCSAPPADNSEIRPPN